MSSPHLERDTVRRRLLNKAVVSRHLTQSGAQECWGKCYRLKGILGRSSGWDRIEWDIERRWYGYRVVVRDERKR